MASMSPDNVAKKSYGLSVIKGIFAICNVEDKTCIPAWLNEATFYAFTRTTDGCSIICPEDIVPPLILCDGKWKLLKLIAPDDGSTRGEVIASIGRILAENNISILVMSTFSSNYILVKVTDFQRAIESIKACGVRMEDGGQLT